MHRPHLGRSLDFKAVVVCIQERRFGINLKLSAPSNSNSSQCRRKGILIVTKFDRLGGDVPPKPLPHSITEWY